MAELSLAAMLPDVAVRLDVACADWREAVRAAGAGLVAAGFTTDAYTEEMIQTVEQLGPYIVIAPGLALAHARPSPAVLATGFSWVRPAEPVAFGHEKNDPVRLVVGLAAIDHTVHQKALIEFATLVSDATVLAQLQSATDVDELRRIIASQEEA